MIKRHISKIQDIAKAAKVSISTVSRVINNFPSVKQEHRKRVLQAIKELNYKPNISARRLAGARNYTLGLVIPYFKGMFSSHYVMQVIEGAEEEATILGWDILININRRNETEEKFYGRVLNRTYVEGVIYAGAKMAAPLFKEGTIPYIVINMRVTDPEVNCIYIENEEGAFNIVEHLIKLGHKKISAIAGSRGVQAAEERLDGYRAALNKYGLLTTASIIGGNFNKMAAYRETLKLLDLSEKPTAIFASSDDMAVAAIKAIKEKGFRVPEDIAVVGFDNRPFAEDMEPKLTTVDQPIAEMGRLAVKILSNIISGKKEVKVVKIALKTKLIIRESCGALLKGNIEPVPK